MKVYTVHEPRKLTGDPVRDAERFAFVRDGFHFWAFTLTPLWLLWRRLWLVFILYVVLIVALLAGLAALGVPGNIRFLAVLLVSLLIGFEAGTLQRWTLSRRKWRTVGVVAGIDHEDAERRFFDSWVAGADRSPPPTSSTMPVMPASPASTDVIGLFPEPESRR
jgi:hypothetical protein